EGGAQIASGRPAAADAEVGIEVVDAAPVAPLPAGGEDGDLRSDGDLRLPDQDVTRVEQRRAAVAVSAGVLLRRGSRKIGVRVDHEKGNTPRRIAGTDAL